VRQCRSRIRRGDHGGLQSATSHGFLSHFLRLAGVPAGDRLGFRDFTPSPQHSGTVHMSVRSFRIASLHYVLTLLLLTATLGASVWSEHRPPAVLAAPIDSINTKID